MQTTAQRPMGITILAVLAIISGVLGILGSLPLLQAGVVVSGSLGGLLTVYVVAALIVSILTLAFGVGAWTLQPWAWTLGVAAEVLSAVLVVLGMLIVGFSISLIINLAITAAILYYPFTPEVKRAFGKA